jgi:predicted permease
MPDWPRYVRDNLRLTRALPADEAAAIEEIARQLDDAYVEALNRGLPPEEAEKETRLHITDWKKLARVLPCNRRNSAGFVFHEERTSRMGIVDRIDSLLRDIRYAARGLRKSGGFFAVAVLTLGLGIGANTIIFSAINSLLLNPVGLPDADRILALRVNYEKLSISKSPAVSIAEFMDARDSTETFSAVGMATVGNYNYSTAGFPERLLGQRVTWQWFDVFGVKPMLGRGFAPEEDQQEANRVAVLAYGTWQQLFGGDPSIVDKTIQLNQQPYKIIGVMGPSFRRREVSLWTPIGLPPAAYTLLSRFNESYEVVARLKPGVSVEQGMARLRFITTRAHEAEGPKGKFARDNGWSVSAQPYPEALAGDLKSPMFLLMGAVGFVLSIACANVAGLVLARAAGRSRELAVRTALGAGRWRLVGQTLADSLLMGAGGLAVGMLVAYGGIRILLALAPQDLDGVAIELDATILSFTAIISLAASVFIGLIPAVQIAAGQKMASLKEGGRPATATRTQLRLRSLLVTFEIAVALILLVGAGLFLRSLAELQKVDTGFEPDGIMTGIVALPPPLYRDIEKQRAFHRAVLEYLEGAPGVTAAATGVSTPFIGGSGGAFAIEGTVPQPGAPTPQGRTQMVSPGYFSTMGIPIVRGRTFTEQDTAAGEPVVVIDEDLARQYWPNEDPIGKRIRRTLSNAPWTTIVGIVRPVKQSALIADTRRGVHYYPVYQAQGLTNFAILARTRLEPAQLSNAIREAVRTADPSQPVFDLRTMDERILASLGTRRFALNLMIIFAGVAIFMAAIGLYGVISYLVAQRTHEIGIRMALGARQTQILAMVVGQGMRLAIAGIVAGVMGAALLAQVLAGELFQVSSFDPLTFGLTAAMVGIVAFLACIIPARRATAVDPMDACRYG